MLFRLIFYFLNEQEILYFLSVKSFHILLFNISNSIQCYLFISLQLNSSKDSYVIPIIQFKKKSAHR